MLLIIAIMAALIVPRMFYGSLDQLNNESQRLQQSLRLAVQESSLTGSPIRWSGYLDSYRFEQADEEGGWQAIDGKVFSNHELSASIRIAEVRIEALEVTGDRPIKRGEAKPALGQIIIYPDGMLTLADIVLIASDSKGAIKTIQVRPGLDGVLAEIPDE